MNKTYDDISRVNSHHKFLKYMTNDIMIINEITNENSK